MKMVVAFFLACVEPWENAQPSIPHLHLLFFLSLKMEISLSMLFPFFMQGSVHSGSGSGDDCGQMFSDKLHVSLDNGIASPLRLRWVKDVCVFLCNVKDVCVFLCNVPIALLAE